MSPPTYMSCPMPTPPATTSVPVVVEVAEVVLCSNIDPVLNTPSVAVLKFHS